MAEEPERPPFRPRLSDVFRFILAPYIALAGAAGFIFAVVAARHTRQGLIIRAGADVLVATGFLLMMRLRKRLRPGPTKSVLGRPRGWEWAVIAVGAVFASVDLVMAAIGRSLGLFA